MGAEREVDFVVTADDLREALAIALGHQQREAGSNLLHSLAMTAAGLLVGSIAGW